MTTFELKTKDCSGPLDLLLNLIDDKKLEITDLSISEVTEQFLNHIDEMDVVEEVELADFLVIASKLLLFKARMLLPQFAPPEEEDDADSLATQLRLYKRFVAVSKHIAAKFENTSHWSAFRIEPVRAVEGFVWPANVTTDTMKLTMARVVKRLKPLKELPTTRIDRAVSMKAKIDKIRNALQKRGNLMFTEIVSQATNKTDVIVSFLALLELVKTRTVLLSQEENFGDIMISSN